MTRDNKATVDTRLAMTFAARTADVTNAPVIDTQGFNSATFVVVAGAVSTASAGNSFAFTLRHSDASDMSGDEAVPAGQFHGTAVIDATAQANTVRGRIRYSGSKRYLRLIATETGTADAVFGAVVNLGHPEQAPV